MFENLIESRPKKVRTWKQQTVSIVLHLVVGYAAIKATAGAAEELTKVLQDTTNFMLAPPPPPPPPPDQPPPEAIVTANPPPLGFQTVMPPTEIPKDIPPVNLNERFNAADFTGKGVEGGVATGVAGGTGPVTGETFLQDQVDDPVQVISKVSPRYPPVLQQAGVSGYVEATWVVDTLGHAESNSWKVLKSTNTQFEAPAREAILKALYKPARIKGAAVRQLVQQRISFNIGQ
jgi:periplasmic protein TonB